MATLRTPRGAGAQAGAGLPFLGPSSWLTHRIQADYWNIHVPFVAISLSHSKIVFQASDPLLLHLIC